MGAGLAGVQRGLRDSLAVSRVTNPVQMPWLFNVPGLFKTELRDPAGCGHSVRGTREIRQLSHNTSAGIRRLWDQLKPLSGMVEAHDGV